MPKIPLIGGYSQGRVEDVNSHLCTNLMLKYDNENGKERWYWVHSPGSLTAPFETPHAAADKILGMTAWKNEIYFVTHITSSAAYYLYKEGGSNLGGVSANAGSRFIMAASDTQLCAVGGGVAGHIYVYDGTTFSDVTKWANRLSVTAIAQTSGTTYTVTVSDTLTPDIIGDGDTVYLKMELAGWTGEYTVASLNESAKTFTVTQTGAPETDTELTASDAYVLHQGFDKVITAYPLTNVTGSAGAYTVLVAQDLVGVDIANTDPVFIRGTTNFNGSYSVSSLSTSANTFVINPAGTFGTEAAGTAYVIHTSASGGIKPAFVDMIDSYFVINNTASNTQLDYNKNDYYVSYPGDARIWQAANNGSAQRFADDLLALKVFNGELYLFGQSSLEIHYNTGEGTQPFAPSRNLALPWGTVARFSIAEVDGSVYWVASQPSGIRCVARIKDYSVEKVSNPAVDNLLSRTGDMGDQVTGWAFPHMGAACYGLTDAGAINNFDTLVYDATTSKISGVNCWSRWTAGTPITSGVSAYSDINSFMYYNRDSQYIRQLSDTTYTWGYGASSAAAITRTGISGAVHLDDKSLFHKRVFIDMENPTGTGYINLSWSDDGGNSYGSERSKLFTTANTRVEYFGLGRARTSRVYKVTTTAALPITILGMYADLEEGIF